MINVQSRKRILTDSLTRRYEDIKRAKELIVVENTINNASIDNFRSSIAFYMHYIYSTSELLSILEKISRDGDTIKYKEQLRELIEGTRGNMSDLATYILELEEFENVLGKWEQKWGNVFGEGGFLLTSKEFLLEMKSIRDLGRFNAQKLCDMKNILFSKEFSDGSIIAKLEKEGVALDNRKIKLTMKCLCTLIKEFAYAENFRLRYANLDAVEVLERIYRVNNPLMEECLVDSLHNKVVKDFDHEMLCCDRLHRQMLCELDIGATKDALIKRFKTYMEIFKPLKVSENIKMPEKALQSKFEEFLFYNGMFPISETVLGNGRSDTIELNNENAFLYEFKQVGFGKTKETKASIERKIKIGANEIKKYHGRLSSLPNLTQELYVIIFSGKPITLSNDYKYIEGLHCFFYVVDLSNVSPSKQDPIFVKI